MTWISQYNSEYNYRPNTGGLLDLKDIIRKNQVILRHYGAQKQIVKCLEELNELSNELIKDLTMEGDKDAIVDEIADCLNMAIQMALLYGYDSVRGRMEYKISRTLKRMLHKEGDIE